MTDDLAIENVNNTPLQMDQLPEAGKPIAERIKDKKKRDAEFIKEMERLKNPSSSEQAEISQEVTNQEPQEVPSIELDEEKEDLDTKIIPKKRLDKEIEKRKRLEEQLQQERDSRIKYETELGMYNRALEEATKYQQEALKPKELEFDPIDDDAHNLYMRKIQELEQKLNSQQNGLSDYQRQQQFAQALNYQQMELSKKHPDVDDAYNYLVELESKKARTLGYSDEQASQFAINQLQPLAWELYNKGKNVAETMYEMAKSYGYSSKGERAAPNLEKIERNMSKSQSALDEIPSTPVSVNPEDNLGDIEYGDFQRRFYKDGRKIDVRKFHDALKKVQMQAKLKK